MARPSIPDTPHPPPASPSRPASASPALSVVVLTWNEQRSIRDCLTSLSLQHDRDFEVIVVDAASTDSTADIVRRLQPGFPVPLRLVVAGSRLPIGAARNLGVRLAGSERVAFISADAEAAPDWTARALAGLASADMVFGRQVHAPHEWTAGAAVRGLRYHFPESGTAQPLRYASHVGAAYRKSVLAQFPFDPAARAAEDLLLACRASAAGARASYDPGMVVRHHDVATARAELGKNLREGAACGRHAAELGTDLVVAGWLAAVAAALAFVLARPGWPALALLALVAWLPAMRRVARRFGHMPAAPLLLGAVASPPFDLAFAGSYAVGWLAARRRHDRGGQPEARP